MEELIGLALAWYTYYFFFHAIPKMKKKAASKRQTTVKNASSLKIRTIDEISSVKTETTPIDIEDNYFIQKRKEYWSWKIKDSFFSKAELFFYKKLANFCDDKWLYVFSKVRIADLTTPKYHLDKSSFMRVFLRLSQKHVDYVITNTRGKIICVLELDWKSHSYWKTLENDRFKNKFFDDIGLPLLRFSNYWNHDFSKIEKLIWIFY